MRNPNRSKYFDEKYGCTLNKECPVCKNMIYVPEGIYTVYQGKKHYHNREDRVMSVIDMTFGAMCEDCFESVNGES